MKQKSSSKAKPATKPSASLAGGQEAFQQYASIFQHADWGMVIADPETHVMTNVNPAFARMHGYVVEEMVGMNLADIFAPESRAELPEHAHTVHEHGHLIYESIHLRKDGSRFPCRTDVTAFKDAAGQVLFRAATFEDITLTKQAEAQLEKSRRLLTETEEMGKVGGWEFYIDTGKQVWTDEVYRIHELGPDFDPTVGNGINFYTPESRPIIEQAVQRVIDHGEPFDLELEIITAKGHRRSVHTIGKADPEHCRIYGFFQDITDRKRAEENILHERNFSEAALDSVPGLFYLFDEQGLFLRFNKNFEQVSGYSAEELYRMTPQNLFDETDWLRVEHAIQQVYQTGEVTVEADFLSKNKIKTPYFFTGKRFQFDQKTCVAGMGIDITERKRAEDASRASADRIRNMSDAAGAYLWEVDLNMVYTYVSGQSAAVKGRTPEELLGHTPQEFMPEEDIAPVAEIVNRAINDGSTFRLEHRDITPSGDILWEEVYGSVFCDHTNEVVGLRGTGIDITERKRAEEETERLSRFPSENPNPVLRISIQGILEYANTAADILLSTMGTEVGGRINPEWQARIGEAMEKACTVDFELQAGDRSFAATLAPVMDQGYVNLYARDITKRRLAEQEKDRLIMAIEQVAEIIMITDAEGTIRYVNSAFEIITGYSREEAIGQNPRMLKSGQQSDVFYQKMWTALLRGTVWTGRLVNRKKDGTFYTEDATISPVMDSDGTIVNYVAIKTDITVKMAIESRLLQSQKMESIGRLAGGIAHDFNNILQTITGFSEILMMGIDGCIAGQPANWASKRADVEQIHKAALHAADLTRQLLTFSRKRPVEHRMIELNAVLRDEMRMLERVIEDRIDLQFDLCPEPLPVSADSSQIVQIIMNLVTNARDAMPLRGTVRVATQRLRITEDETRKIAFSYSGEFACLSVSDDGKGMNTEQLKHLFEPFYTSKEIGQGTGLGLSIIYGIVQDHGGWINVSSAINEGTLFQVYVPIHQGEVDVVEVLPEVAGADNLRILLVEGDPVVRSLAAEILQSAGYEVSAAGTAHEAEELFTRKGGAFDLLFTDVLLPAGNGIELAEALTAQHTELSVLLFSGGSDAEINLERIKQKGFAFMKKPFSMSAVLNAVRQTIQEA